MDHEERQELIKEIQSNFGEHQRVVGMSDNNELVVANLVTSGSDLGIIRTLDLYSFVHEDMLCDSDEGVIEQIGQADQVQMTAPEGHSFSLESGMYYFRLPTEPVGFDDDVLSSGIAGAYLCDIIWCDRCELGVTDTDRCRATDRDCTTYCRDCTTEAICEGEACGRCELLESVCECNEPELARGAKNSIEFDGMDSKEIQTVIEERRNTVLAEHNPALPIYNPR